MQLTAFHSLLPPVSSDAVHNATPIYYVLFSVCLHDCTKKAGWVPRVVVGGGAGTKK